MSVILSYTVRYFPQMKGPDSAAIVYVLVAGGADDYAAYAGCVPDTSVACREWVADHGDKLACKEAMRLFHGIEPERYRE